MNVQSHVWDPKPVLLTVHDFQLLRGFGTLDAYWKVELIDGELWGTLADDGDEPETDAVTPIALTIEQYSLLARSEAFLHVPKTELIDGLVYAMSPQHRPHGFVKDELAYRLRRALEAMDSPLRIATEQSVALGRNNQPQPDIILTSEPRGDGAIPGASIALIVEVADSTAAFDLKRKRSIYAAAGIPEYWVVDVNKRTVRRLWDLQDGQYEERSDHRFGDSIAAATLEGLAIGTDGI